MQDLTPGSVNARPDPGSVDDATSIDDTDFEPLRALGLSDVEIMNVVLAASARCFFSKTLDALGVLPDASYADEFAPEELEVLVVGRPIAEAGQPYLLLSAKRR